MGALALGIGAATVAWFVAAAVSFFNSLVDKIYRSEEERPAVRTLPKAPKTIGMILATVLVQCVLWAGVFRFMRPVLGPDNERAAVLFGLDAIEFVIGILMAFVVGFSFASLIPYVGSTE